MGNGAENEASLAAIRARKEGRQDWRWGGRDFPRISRILRANRSGLTVPYFRTLIAAKNASIFGDTMRPGIGAEMAPKMRNPYPRLGPIKMVFQMCGGLAAIFQKFLEISDQSLGVSGALFLNHNRG